MLDTSHIDFHMISFNVTIAVCGADLTSQEGEITSPNFPSNYPHDRQCEWTVTVPQGQQIHVNVSSFLLERPSPLGRCYDFLEIR